MVGSRWFEYEQMTTSNGHDTAVTCADTGQDACAACGKEEACATVLRGLTIDFVLLRLGQWKLGHRS